DYEGAKEIWEEFLRNLERIYPGLIPIGPAANEVVELENGVFRNSKTLFMPSDTIEFFVSATPDQGVVKRDTILVNGYEVLPEAAGRAAVTTQADNPEAQPTTTVLHKHSNAALGFRSYSIDNHSSVMTVTMLGDIGFDISGDFELSELNFAADNTSQAIPRDTRWIVTTETGSIFLILDESNPGNRLRLDDNGKGVLRGAYMVKGTDTLDVLSEVITSVWVELPVEYDFVTGAISIPFDEKMSAVALVPDTGVKDNGNPHGAPGWFGVGCNADTQQGLTTGACACLDTDGDGVPDSYAFEEPWRSVYLQHINIDWCDD
ncbi:MAG: hypothetical protein AAGH64_07605, partial [Planctomycetota bacterium]